MRMVTYSHYVILFITLSQTNATPQVTLISNVTVGGTVCPDAVQFICNGVELGRLRWVFNNEINDVKRFQTDSQPTVDTTEDGIVVELISVEQFTHNRGLANFSSSLTVDLSFLKLEMIQSVQCGDLSINESANIPNFEIRTAPPPPVYFCNIAEESLNSVRLTLTWDVGIDNVDMYMYCVRATGGSCPAEECVATDTPYTCGGIVAGQEHSFTVRTVNCGNQEGTNDTFTVEPRVPTQLGMCTSVPVYEESTNILNRIKTSWSAIANLPEIKAGTSQDITDYFLLYGSVEIHVSSEMCTPEGQCSYSIYDSFLGSELDYTVTVAAKNIVGRGQTTTCTPQQISSTNTAVDINTNTVAESPTVQCDFLTVLIAPAQCEVCYSTNPLCQNPTCLNEQAGVGGIAVINLPSLEKAVQYCYTVTARIGEVTVAIVEGTFSTACDTSDLTCHRTTSNNNTILDQRCTSTDNNGSVSIRNGVVCYTGISAGSTATYQCDAGYEVATGDNPRTCQKDGNWDGYTVVCVQAKPKSKIEESNIASLVGVTFVSTFIGTLSIGAIVGVLMLYFMKKYTKQQKTFRIFMKKSQCKYNSNHQQKSNSQQVLQ